MGVLTSQNFGPTRPVTRIGLPITLCVFRITELLKDFDHILNFKPFKNKVLGIDANFEIPESRDFLEFKKFKFVFSFKIFEIVKRNIE